MLANRVQQAAGGKSKASALVSLLHFDGNYTDSKVGQAWTNSNVVLDTTTKKFGTGSLRGYTEAGALISPDALKTLDFTQDFTIEMHIYPTSGVYTESLFRKNNVLTAWRTQMGYFGLNLYCTDGSTITLNVNASVLTANAWHFIRFGKLGNTIFAVIDGTLYTTSLAGKTIKTDATTALYIMGYVDDCMYGYMDEVAIFIGVGDNTTTTPTAPY